MVFSYSIRKINLFLVWNFKYFQVDLLKRILNYISEILYEKNSFCGNFEGVGSNKSFYLNWNWKSVFSYFVAMVKDTRALLFESLMLQFKFEIENSILKCNCFKIWMRFAKVLKRGFKMKKASSSLKKFKHKLIFITNSSANTSLFQIN